MEQALRLVRFVVSRHADAELSKQARGQLTWVSNVLACCRSCVHPAPPVDCVDMAAVDRM